MQEGGQMVVAMAVVVTVALVPIAAAYLQLGYVAGDAPAVRGDGKLVDQSIQRAVASVQQDVAGAHTWSERSLAVDLVRQRLADRVDSLESHPPSRTGGVQIRFNRSDAMRFATEACPGGVGRQFGACRADRGVVVQERAGETVLVGVSVDVEVVSPSGDIRFTRRYRPHGNQSAA